MLAPLASHVLAAACMLGGMDAYMMTQKMAPVVSVQRLPASEAAPSKLWLGEEYSCPLGQLHKSMWAASCRAYANNANVADRELYASKAWAHTAACTGGQHRDNGTLALISYECSSVQDNTNTSTTTSTASPTDTPTITTPAATPTVTPTATPTDTPTTFDTPTSAPGVCIVVLAGSGNGGTSAGAGASSGGTSSVVC